MLLSMVLKSVVSGMETEFLMLHGIGPQLLHPHQHALLQGCLLGLFAAC